MKRSAVVGTLLLAGMCLLASSSLAQTPSSVCAMDSLRLLSPDTIDVEYVSTGRVGVNITWPEVDDAVTTCVAVTDTVGLGVPINLDGIYADSVDRQLELFCLNGGAVGATGNRSVVLEWANVNLISTGQVIGRINLSNNGGLLGRSAAGWQKLNDGLLPYLPRTDILHLAESPVAGGGLLAHVRGNLSKGLWYLSGPDGTWTRLAEDVFPDGTIDDVGITAIAYSPDSADVFAVGTVQDGLFITRDGGITFTQYQSEFAEDGNWSLRDVSALSWAAADRLLVAIGNLGLFWSTDGGTTFDHLSAFLVSQDFPSGGGNVAPSINTILDRGAAGLLVGVDSFGLYESIDGGASWLWLWNALLNPFSEPKDVTAILESPLDGDNLTVGTRTSGFWWTPNGGEDWIPLVGDVEWPVQEGYPQVNNLIIDADAGRYLATVDGLGILSCAVGDTAWALSDIADTGILSYSEILISGFEGVDYLLGTYGGGIYTPNTEIRLSDSIVAAQTDAEYRDLDLGLYITFGEGTFAESTTFGMVFQDFQGYAVWRSELTDPDTMELVGLYDKSNPEFCIEGYCGDESYNVLPNCYADKRAACFNFSNPGTVVFFDDNVYEGFTYNYAVTTFDYGNIATASPISLTAEQLFSARYPGDALSIFGGGGNRAELYVHQDAVDPRHGPEIFAYPNPLRLDSGFSGAEGEDVRFKNLPPESRVQVFTLDGDIVADLGPDLQSGDIIAWTTRNGSELIASGVYISKVLMPEREDFYGKVVVIR